MVVFIGGKGGSGKDSVCKKVLKDIPTIIRAVQYTTRPMRDGEVHGVDYYFLSDCQFNEMKEDGMFLETRMYFTASGAWKYATLKDCIDVDDIFLLWGPNELYRTLKRSNPDSVYGIFLDVSPTERLRRMLSRCSCDEDVIESCRRIYSDERDFDSVKVDYDVHINNTDKSLDECICEVESYISNKFLS